MLLFGLPNQKRVKAFYVAIFNVSDQSQTVNYSFKDLGLPSSSYRMRDLWDGHELGVAASVNVTLRPHASVLYLVR